MRGFGKEKLVFGSIFKKIRRISKRMQKKSIGINANNKIPAKQKSSTTSRLRSIP